MELMKTSLLPSDCSPDTGNLHLCRKHYTRHCLVFVKCLENKHRVGEFILKRDLWQSPAGLQLNLPFLLT